MSYFLSLLAFPIRTVVLSMRIELLTSELLTLKSQGRGKIKATMRQSLQNFECIKVGQF